MVFGPGNRGNVFELIAQIARGRTIVIGDGCNRKSLAYVENVADFLVHALRFGPGSHVYNYADKPDPDMNALVTLAGETLGVTAGGRCAFPMASGSGSAWAATSWRASPRAGSPCSSARIRKYAATTRFANARCLATGFRPRHDLHDALVTTIRREFGARAASGRRPAFSRPRPESGT